MNDELDFSVIEDLSKISMTTYFPALLSKYDEMVLKNSSLIVRNDKSVEECIKELIKTQNVTCVTLYSYGKYMMKKYSTAERKSLMKLTKISFHSGYSAIPYEKASPFAENIDATLQQILESGLDHFWRRHIYESQSQHLQNQAFETDNLLCIELIAIVLTCCVIAIITFLGELIINRIILKKASNLDK